MMTCAPGVGDPRLLTFGDGDPPPLSEKAWVPFGRIPTRLWVRAVSRERRSEGGTQSGAPLGPPPRAEESSLPGRASRPSERSDRRRRVSTASALGARRVRGVLGVLLHGPRRQVARAGRCGARGPQPALPAPPWSLVVSPAPDWGPGSREVAPSKPPPLERPSRAPWVALVWSAPSDAGGAAANVCAARPRAVARAVDVLEARLGRTVFGVGVGWGPKCFSHGRRWRRPAAPPPLMATGAQVTEEPAFGAGGPQGGPAAAARGSSLRAVRVTASGRLLLRSHLLRGIVPDARASKAWRGLSSRPGSAAASGGPSRRLWPRAPARPEALCRQGLAVSRHGALGQLADAVYAVRERLQRDLTGRRSTRELRPNPDAHAVPRHDAPDQLAAAVRAVQERLQRET